MSSNSSLPTYKRQRFLLSFIRQIEQGVYSTDLQKLVFLYTMEGKSNYYEFIPYKYGAYSFQLAEDVTSLKLGGFLYSKGSHIFATNAIEENGTMPIAKERGDTLIRKTYLQYPYYALNSEVINRLFTGEEAERFHHLKNKYARTDSILFTIGYEGRSLENFINTLIVNDVRLLVDVRKNPLSRKFGFSKAKLEHVTETIGIKYIHIPGLGIDSEDRAFLKTKEDYIRLFQAYEETLNQRIKYLNYLYSLFVKNQRIALVCFEKEAEMCHRHVIRDYFTKEYNIRSIDL